MNYIKVCGGLDYNNNPKMHNKDEFNVFNLDLIFDIVLKIKFYDSKYYVMFHGAAIDGDTCGTNGILYECENEEDAKIKLKKISELFHCIN